MNNSILKKAHGLVRAVVLGPEGRTGGGEFMDVGMLGSYVPQTIAAMDRELPSNSFGMEASRFERKHVFPLIHSACLRTDDGWPYRRKRA